MNLTEGFKMQCAELSLFVWRKGRKEEKKDRKNLEIYMYGHTVYIHVFLRIGITYIRHKDFETLTGG